jgi:hypothetical protein
MTATLPDATELGDTPAAASLGRKRRKPWWIGVVAVGGVVFIGGGFGAFSPFANRSTPVDSGTVSLTLSNEGGAASFATAISGLLPDDATATDDTPTDAWDERVIAITNTSNVDTSFLLGIGVSSTSGGADATEAMFTTASPDGVTVQVWRCRNGAGQAVAYTQTTANDRAVCSATEDVLIAETDLPLVETTALGLVPVGQNLSVRVRVRLPQSAPSLAQGDGGILTLTAALRQRDGGAV